MREYWLRKTRTGGILLGHINHDHQTQQGDLECGSEHGGQDMNPGKGIVGEWRKSEMEVPKVYTREDIRRVS
jgi:hypothetical protein